jgi:hypothetical protein
MNQSIQIHSPRAFSIPAFLTAQECSQLIQLAQAHGFSSAGVRTTEGERSMPAIRNNERTMVEAPEWVSLMWSRLCAVDMPAVDGAKVAGSTTSIQVAVVSNAAMLIGSTFFSSRTTTS